MKKEKKEITISEIQKDYGVDFGQRRNMKLSTWLKKIGLPNMGKAYKNIVKKK